MTRVLVVANRPAVRAGLAALLASEPGIVVVDQLPDPAHWPEGEPAPAVGRATEVVVIDPATGAAEVEELAALAPAARIIVLGPLGDEARLVSALAGRAWGYLPRDAEGAQLAAAVRAVASGMVVIEHTLAGRLVAPLPASELGGDELTPREREVLQLIALGLPNKTIAQRLGISEHTVKFHVAAILGRLGAASRTEAVRIGARRGLVVL
ncbi:MAG: response regulator transcription factor [Chloroflexi bacterium]|nr:response regulator transcription factor [Chloroflexota bacterium]